LLKRLQDLELAAIRKLYIKMLFRFLSKEWGLTSQEAQDYLVMNPYNAANWKKSIGEQAWSPCITSL
jgi:hypothetical protein